MTADPLAFLAQLDKAHAEGTADGPWRFTDNGTRFGADNRFEILDDEGSVAVCSDDNDATDTTGFDRTALIVAAVNALPGLTAALRAVLVAADKLDGDADARGRGDVAWGISYATAELRDALAAALSPEQVQP